MVTPSDDSESIATVKVEVPSPQELEKLRQASGLWHVDALKNMPLSDIESIKICSGADDRKCLALEIQPEPKLFREKLWVLVDTGATVDIVKESLVP